MKKLNYISLFIASVIIFSASAFGQSNQKEIEKKIKSKPPKEVRKEAKRLKKEDYKIAPGALPIEKQLEQAYFKQMEQDEDGFSRYIVRTGNSVGKTQTAAKLQATETAKLEIAGAIQTNVAALIENNIGNMQLSPEEAESITETVGASKSLIAQELGRTYMLVELYRNNGETIEANLRLAYDSYEGKELAKEVIRKQLQDKAENLQDKLDELMDF